MKFPHSAFLIFCYGAFCPFFLCAQEKINIEGSTTVGPIIDAFVEAFSEAADSSGNVKFSVKKTGSGDGAAALIDGRCEIATMSRSMKPDEVQKAVKAGKTPTTFTICMDGVCLIVHPSNPVRQLTKEQVKKIYTGSVSNWQELGGADMPIVAISRDTSSGTYEVFHQIAVDSEKLGNKVEYANSNPQIFTRVSTTPGAIGYVGLGFLKTGVATMQYENVVPSRRTIASGKYALSRPLFLLTNGYPPLGTKLLEFCNFFLTEKGQDIIETKGFVPLTNY
ncbi:MAG: phosphate ABC transporter substrate-binding protein [Planctomycetaceae bacterium]|jgi:phosphate transport system substrate-binding protein|nr:phosphate ABC transporter substrate-binding protein [Planctomycetaceae bacterium]